MKPNKGNHVTRNAGTLLAGLFLAGGLCISSGYSVDAKATDNNTDNKIFSQTESNEQKNTYRVISHQNPLREQSGKPRRIASEIPVGVPMIPDKDPLPKPSTKCATAVMETTVKAPMPFVWKTLTDFSGYPQIFPKIASCKVTKRQGNYVYTESYLKPQMFIRECRQRIVNDLNGKPHVLRWAMLEGNFESSQGCWELAPDANGRDCKVKYTLESTTDPIPKSIAGFTLKFVQKDIVKTFKRCTEKLYQAHEAQANGSVAVSP